MTVFQYALLREAGDRMTADQKAIAMELAHAAEAGKRGAADALNAMMYEVLFHYRQPAQSEPTPKVQGALECNSQSSSSV